MTKGGYYDATVAYYEALERERREEAIANDHGPATPEEVEQALDLLRRHLAEAKRNLKLAQELPEKEAFQPTHSKRDLIDLHIRVWEKTVLYLSGPYEVLRYHKVPDPLTRACPQCKEMIIEAEYQSHVRYHLDLSMQELEA